jgi:hypothetical protein
MTHNSEVTCEPLYYSPFLLDSFETIHISVLKEKTAVILLQLLGSTGNISLSGDQALEICSTLLNGIKEID